MSRDDLGANANSAGMRMPKCLHSQALALLMMLNTAVPSLSFVVPFRLSQHYARTSGPPALRTCPTSPVTGGFSVRDKRLAGPYFPGCRAMGHKRDSIVSRLSAVSDTPLPSDPDALQTQLWKAADVLPDLQETKLRLAKTQETGVSDLGFVATGPISKGDIMISVPMR